MSGATHWRPYTPTVQPEAPTARPEQALRTFADKLLNAQPNPPDIDRAINENLMELIEPAPTAAATPRTDAAPKFQVKMCPSLGRPDFIPYVSADFARTLERELQAAQAEVARLNEDHEETKLQLRDECVNSKRLLAYNISLLAKLNQKT